MYSLLVYYSSFSRIKSTASPTFATNDLAPWPWPCNSAFQTPVFTSIECQPCRFAPWMSDAGLSTNHHIAYEQV